jgi:hypothetical protein
VPRPIPQVSFPSGDIMKAAASPMAVPTANPMWNMTLAMRGGKLTATDAHDTVAAVTSTKSPHVFLVDKMLLPGERRLGSGGVWEV